ncbi:MAG: efflux RND transporter periplasmic adaptor subunit [Lachnospiraceae bacterium]|jgi:RND family efflux transporter MFP subunit|nr:efflux RND transporter periplasmic adaptor subunit [Lachnospiraceae bacterium]
MSKEEKNIQNTEGGKKTRRRKKKKLKFIIPVVAVLVVVIVVKSFSGKKSVAIPVYTDKISVGDIDTELNVSGKVVAEESVTFFAPAEAKVEEVEVQKGDIVKAGDVLLCFDEEAVAYAKQKSELEQRISSADYSSNVQYNDEQKAKLAEAEAEIAQCEAVIDSYEQYIDDLTNSITDLTALKKSDLYAKIYKVEKEINNYDLAIQTPTKDTDVEMLMGKKVEKQNELNKLNNELSLLSDYKTDYGWEDMLTQAKKVLADYQERLSEAKSVKAGAESAVVNGNKLEGYALNKEKTKLEGQDAERKYKAVLNGIVADFNGVISDLNVVKGATVQEGTQLMVLESIDNVCVEFQASKYALETLVLGQPAEITISGKSYTGTVSKINHIAEENTSGTATVAARIHIDNPDENIFLGLDAKLKILTASEKGVLQVPVEAVNVDSQGEFCYLIENGVLAKKYVKTGISSETYIQILDGLSENQEIVTTSVYGIGLDEGMTVTGMPISGMSGAEIGGAGTESTGVNNTVSASVNDTESTDVNDTQAQSAEQEDADASQKQTEDGTDNG